MDKSTLLNQLQVEMEALLRRHHQANRQAAAGATDEQSRAETKWDTNGLEASYLARGHARQFKELALQLDELRALEARSFERHPVGIGALVSVDLRGQCEHYLLLRQGGGQTIGVSGFEVTVITQHSPLGAAMMGRSAGDRISMPDGETGLIQSVQ